MKLISAISLSLTCAKLVAGHAYVWGISVNGKDQGRGDAVPGYIRKIVNNDPVKDVKSSDMTCNRNGGPNSKIIDAKGGDKVCLPNSFFESVGAYGLLNRSQ
jgi:cellulase